MPGNVIKLVKWNYLLELWASFKNKSHCESNDLSFISDVFVDEGKKSYKALDFKVMGYLELIPAILSAAARAAQGKAKALGLGGNMSGDGYQNGGCLVVEKGGGDKPLLYYVQKGAPDHVANSDVLKVNGVMFIKLNI